MSTHDDYQRLPLERLRAIAASGGDVRARTAAQREIDARAAAADRGTSAPQTAVRVTTAEHGTPQLVVIMPREAGVRRLCARLHQLTAAVETALAATHGWTTLRVSGTATQAAPRPGLGSSAVVC